MATRFWILGAAIFMAASATHAGTEMENAISPTGQRVVKWLQHKGEQALCVIDPKKGIVLSTIARTEVEGRPVIPSSFANGAPMARLGIVVHRRKFADLFLVTGPDARNVKSVNVDDRRILRSAKEIKQPWDRFYDPTGFSLRPVGFDAAGGLKYSITIGLVDESNGHEMRWAAHDLVERIPVAPKSRGRLVR
jgi:hypothetical protein